jgi:hypothetical protein
MNAVSDKPDDRPNAAIEKLLKTRVGFEGERLMGLAVGQDFGFFWRALLYVLCIWAVLLGLFWFCRGIWSTAVQLMLALIVVFAGNYVSTKRAVKYTLLSSVLVSAVFTASLVVVLIWRGVSLILTGLAAVSVVLAMFLGYRSALFNKKAPLPG